MSQSRGPTGPGAPLDPETAARLRRLLDPRAPPPAGPVRRPGGPPQARIEVAYVLELPSVSRPILEVLCRRVAPGEKAGPWEIARVSDESLFTRFPEAEDREIVGALLGAAASTASTQLTIDEAKASRFALSRAACARVLPLLGKTERFRLRRPARDLPLAWSEAPWVLRLRVTVASAEPGAPPPADGLPPWEVHGVLRAGSQEVRLTALDAYLESGFAVGGGQLGRVDDGGASSWLGLLLAHRAVRITPARRAAFLEELHALPAPPPLDLPGELALPEVSVAATPRLEIFAPLPGAAGPLYAALSFVYEGVIVPARRPGRVAFDAAGMRFLRRDAEAEAKARARVDELGAEPPPKSSAVPPPEGAHLAIAPARLPSLVAALVEEGFRVEAGGRRYRRPGAWQTSIRSGVDWLEIDGHVAFDEIPVRLPAVLAALRRGDNLVVLDDGTVGVLPEAWLARHGLVLRLGTAHEGRVRFAPSQVPLLAALAAAEPRVQVDDGFLQLSGARDDGALAADSATVGAPPEGFRGELRGYQREGLGWLRAVDRAGLGGLLADEMGLGKTVQVLAHLAGRRGGTSLVVAPRSLVFNWKREAARFAPGLRVLDHTGPDRRPPGAHFAAHELVLTTYGTLRRDVDALAAVAFDYVVLDEAQAIKNDASETARAARRLCAGRRLALSGTPVENHLGELWSIVEFVNPGMLGRAAAWKAVADASPSPDAVALLGRALRPIMLRRTKTEVAPELPARLEETWVCELDARERALYEELRARFRAELLGHVRRDGLGKSQARVLEALLRLRQAACHPGLLDPKRRGEKSAKLDALLPELLALRENGQKALVFSQFRGLLEIVRPQLEAEGIVCAQLDGATRDREATVARFQDDPACGVLLVSLKAGGVGLNLTAAEYVFLLDPWWNPAAEAQAIDRAHRIGQTKPVFAYRLIAGGTVEERIAELQQRKRALAESVIRGDGAPLRELSVEDLDALLS